MDLSKKIYNAKKILRKGQRPLGLAMSFGKDSVVVLKMMVEEFHEDLQKWRSDCNGTAPPFLAVWVHNKDTWPSTFKYAERLQQDWVFPLVMVEGVTPRQAYEQLGFPVVPFLAHAGKRNRDYTYTTDTEFYNIIRDNPLHHVLRQLKIKTLISGVRSDDSWKGKQDIDVPREQRRGSSGTIVDFPIGDWTRKEVEAFIEQKGIPEDDLWSWKDKVAVEGEIVPDCWSDLLGFSPKRAEFLRDNYPDLYEQLPWKEWEAFIKSGYLEEVEEWCRITRETLKMRPQAALVGE